MITVVGSGGDDTAAVQAAIDSQTGGGVVHLVGTFHVSSLDVTKRYGITIQGENTFATKILPIANSNSVLDLSGSYGITLRDFKLGESTSTYCPAVGILALQTKNTVGNWLRFRDIYVDGTYTLASFYNYGFASSYFSGCAFWNFRNSAQKAFAVSLFSDNYNNMSSPYLPTDGSAFSVATGTSQPLSDLQFDGCEFHAHTASGAANSSPISMRGAQAIGFSAGNASGSGFSLVDTNSDIYARKCRTLSFRKVTFYSENGTQPQYIFQPSATVEGVLVHYCAESNIPLCSYMPFLNPVSHI